MGASSASRGKLVSMVIGISTVSRAKRHRRLSRTGPSLIALRIALRSTVITELQRPSADACWELIEMDLVSYAGSVVRGGGAGSTKAS